MADNIPKDNSIQQEIPAGNSNEKSVPQEVQALQTSNFDLLPVFPELEDDPLESENFLEMLNKIEKENAKTTQVVPIRLQRCRLLKNLTKISQFLNQT